jgi:hypothetical protein
MLERLTLVQDYCWVCNKRFKTSVPPGPAIREDHHIFPRNAGGDDGPLVSLCDTHHSCIHKIANRMHRSASYTDLLVGETSSKLIWLAQKIVKAEQYAKNDPNKLFNSGLKLTQQESAMLTRLQKHYQTSRADVLKAALYKLFQETFNAR